MRAGLKAALCVGLAAMAATIAITPAEAQRKRAFPLVQIPFEQERSSQRVSLNMEAHEIPGGRILGVPVVDGKMGEHAQLDGIDLWFPYGRVVAAYTEYDIGNATHARRVRDFDRALGAVCANANGVEMRLQRQTGTIALVRRGADANHYKMIVTAEQRWLERFDTAPEVAQLYADCLSGKPVRGQTITAGVNAMPATMAAVAPSPGDSHLRPGRKPPVPASARAAAN